MSPWVAIALASCSTLVGIEDPMSRPCDGEDCSGAAGETATQPARGGAPEQPSTGGDGGHGGHGGNGNGGIRLKGDSGATGLNQGGILNVSSSGGGGNDTGGQPPDPECEETAVRCDVYQPEHCVDGQWAKNGAECPLACVDGACQEPPSCDADAPTVPCVDQVSCCETIWVPGGSYQMADGDEEEPEVSYERSVSGFYLDRFEVTVSRFEMFISEFSLPAEGQGAHPKIAGSGWHKSWENIAHPFADGRKVVPVSKDDLILQITDDCGGAGSYSAEDRELPINCTNWYVAFAFCAWDGGRLPTEAEWNYAAAAGDQQRPYPWSTSATDISINAEKATYYDYPTPPPAGPTPVGSHPTGRSAFFRYPGAGHDDLAGNVSEWTLDQWSDAPQESCADCFGSWTEEVEDRVSRGGTFGSAYSDLRTGWRGSVPASQIDVLWGFRCARDIDKPKE